MFSVFSFSFNAVMPILVMAFLGYIIKCRHFADDNFFKKLNSLNFKVFLPILLYYNVYEIESLKSINVEAIIYCVFAILLICFCGYGVAKLFGKKRSQYGVLTQCSFRSNFAIIGLPLAETLGGAPAVAFASVLSAVAIPLFNVLAVILLSHYAESEYKQSIKATIKKTLKNPLIIGVATGIVTLIVRALLTKESGEVVFTIEDNMPFLYSAIKSVSRIASPLALVVLGARFDFSKVKDLLVPIITGSFMRLVFAPLLGVGLAFVLSEYSNLLTVTQIEYPALISLFSTPVAVSSAVMTSEIGGDEQLAGQLVVWTSVLSMFTMFIIVFVMKSSGLI